MLNGESFIFYNAIKTRCRDAVVAVEYDLPTSLYSVTKSSSLRKCFPYYFVRNNQRIVWTCLLSTAKHCFSKHFYESGYDHQPGSISSMQDPFYTKRVASDVYI